MAHLLTLTAKSNDSAESVRFSSANKLKPEATDRVLASLRAVDGAIVVMRLVGGLVVVEGKNILSEIH